MAALSVVIDAATLTRDAELIYIVTGVKVYAMNRRGQILHQTPGQVLKHSDNLTMHRVHDCSTPTPEEFVKPEPAPPVITPTTDEVPF